MTDVYRIRAAAVWAQARTDYLSGLSAEVVCRRHELGLSAFRRRARKYGWRRSDQVAPPSDETDLSLYEDISLDEQAETARLRFVEALETGRATDARRWRGLWLELRDAAHEGDAEFFKGMSREAVEAMMEQEHADIAEEDEALLGPPPPDCD